MLAMLYIGTIGTLCMIGTNNCFTYKSYSRLTRISYMLDILPNSSSSSSLIPKLQDNKYVTTLQTNARVH